MACNLIAPSAKRAGMLAFAAVLAGSLAFPPCALAVVRVDQSELAQGDNAVGGGTATLADSNLAMAGVTAGELYIDENLSMNFNGDNTIDQVSVAGSAEVDMNFTGENEVEEVHAADESNVTINADGHNEFEEIVGHDDASITINVTGENGFEEIVGYDNANITVRGTDCQKEDVVRLGEDENDTELSTDRGALTIDHVTVSLEGKDSRVGSANGKVTIDTAKIVQGEDNEYACIAAGGTMKMSESVIDITGTVRSRGKMTIDHSDVKVKAPDAKYGDKSPYRVFSETGIELIREKNGMVAEGIVDGVAVWRVDTGDGDAVNLKANGTPAYYGCSTSKADGSLVKAMPKTGDTNEPLFPLAIALASATTAGFAARRRYAND